MTDLERAKGVIFGLAVGDALGAATEFLKLDQVKTRFGKDGIRDLQAARATEKRSRRYVLCQDLTT